MSTEQELKELMGLVGNYGTECISRGIAELNSSNAVKQRFSEDVRKSHNALTDRLRALLAELDAAREDARKNQTDAECFRWWVHEAEANPGLVAKAISHCITEDDYRQVICGAMEAKNAVIDAARKGEA